MLYSIIAEIYREIEKTTKRLEIIDLLVNLFKKTRKNFIDKIVYLTQGKLYPDYMGIEIGIADKLALKAIAMAAGFPVAREANIAVVVVPIFAPIVTGYAASNVNIPAPIIGTKREVVMELL